MEELKEAITKTLEKQGVLTKIRAELRASVFRAIEDEEGVGTLSKRADNPRLKKLMSMPNGLLVIGLVREFMTWAGLSFSVKVFDPEVAITEKVDRAALKDRLGLHGGDDLPLIGALMESFLDEGGQEAGRKAAEPGLRGPRPQPVIVSNSSLDRSQSDTSEMAPSPYDVTTPSSAFLGQDDLPSAKSINTAPTRRGKSPLGRFGSVDVDSSQELDNSISTSFEIEDDGNNDDDADIEADAAIPWSSVFILSSATARRHGSAAMCDVCVALALGPCSMTTKMSPLLLHLQKAQRRRERLGWPSRTRTPTTAQSSTPAQTLCRRRGSTPCLQSRGPSTTPWTSRCSSRCGDQGPWRPWELPPGPGCLRRISSTTSSARALFPRRSHLTRRRRSWTSSRATPQGSL
mmetsp:Transcript_8902/g.25645  ORF Transcript_8902/g.25645 Transcript_8902/m.25645 type:complete len:404 (-) Transcript_8902:428-1639(-)